MAGWDRLWQACRLADWDRLAGWGRLWQAVTDCARLGQSVADYDIYERLRQAGWLGQTVTVKLWQAVRD